MYAISTTATPLYTSPPTIGGNRVKAAVSYALSQTFVGDAFRFRDAYDHVIHVEKLNLYKYGRHWRLYHNGITHILIYKDEAEEKEVKRWITLFMERRAVWGTLRLMPMEALTFAHDGGGRWVVV